MLNLETELRSMLYGNSVPLDYRPSPENFTLRAVLCSVKKVEKIGISPYCSAHTYPRSDAHTSLVTVTLPDTVASQIHDFHRDSLLLMCILGFGLCVMTSVYTMVSHRIASLL